MLAELLVTGSAIAEAVPITATEPLFNPVIVELPFETHYITSIVRVSLYVSLIAVALSTLFSIPIAMFVGFKQFPGKGIVISIINTGMGFPSVVVGLVVLFMLSSSGPFGALDLVFTPEAMIISQFILAAPVITGVSLAAVTSVEGNLRDAAYVMGGTRLDVALVVIKEAKYGIATAVLAGFGRAISEVGSVLIVGGNIATADGTAVTRNLTQAIQLEARQGRFETAMFLGAILLMLVLGVNSIVVRLGEGGVQR